MPHEARALGALRAGAYDEPPASGESSTPRTRRGRLRRAIQDTDILARERSRTRIQLPLPSSGARRSIYSGPSARRRRRSSSAAEEGRAHTSPEASTRNSSRSHRYKRRRLEDISFSPAKHGIKYGHYGQVEPGRLKLDLISCDGGEHRDPRHPGTSLGAENLLRHDKSVYCSERPRANVIFRHKDEATPFCLEKLWVVAPEHGFTAPVKEGIVFVAMELNDLSAYIDPPPHARRSRYNPNLSSRGRFAGLERVGNRSPSPYSSHQSQSRRPLRLERIGVRQASPERLTLAEALRDPEISAASTADDRGTSNAVGGADEDRFGFLRDEDFYDEDFGPERTDVEARCEVPSSQTTNLDITTNSDSANRQITLLSDEELEPEETSTPEVLDYRLQRLRLARRRFEAEHLYRQDGRWSDRNPPPPLPELNQLTRDITNQGLNRLDALMARSRVRDSPATFTASPERMLNESSTPRAVIEEVQADDTVGDITTKDGIGSDLESVTSARFYIKRQKSRVAIKFDPPVSGRFIMVKMWADSRSDNVDAQSIIAMGYGGGRFFPATSVR